VNVKWMRNKLPEISVKRDAKDRFVKLQEAVAVKTFIIIIKYTIYKEIKNSIVFLFIAI